MDYFTWWLNSFFLFIFLQVANNIIEKGSEYMDNYNMPETMPEGYTFSNLTPEELKAVKNAENQINQQHGTNLYLIAYDKSDEV